MCELNGPCVDEWRRTRRAEGGFDEGFRSGGYRLHRPGLFGCKLLQADPPLVEHLLHRHLLLENLFHLVLRHRELSKEDDLNMRCIFELSGFSQYDLNVFSPPTLPA